MQHGCVFLAGMLADAGLARAVMTDAGQPGQGNIGGRAHQGRIYASLTGEGALRLKYLCDVMQLAPHQAMVAGQAMPAFVLPEGASALQTAALLCEVMSGFGHVPADRARERVHHVALRAAARLRAGAESSPEPGAATAGVEILARREPYARFFSVEEYDLRHRRFDGAMSPPITRATFISGDAVTVLPYDPVRDRVLLVEQFRTGPMARGDRHPWQFEAIAGRIDSGETPEAAARREALEEAGLRLDRLLPIARYYPSPGISAEVLYSYLALCDLPDGIEGIHGLADEAEDIRGHLFDFARLTGMLADDRLTNAPTLLSVLWLQTRREGLRATGQPQG